MRRWGDYDALRGATMYGIGIIGKEEQHMNLMQFRPSIAIFKTIIAAGVALGATSPVLALDFLGDLIDSAKCAGASDVEACKAKSKAEYEAHAARKRGEQPSQASDSQHAADSSSDAKQPTGSEKQMCWTEKWGVAIDVDTAYARALQFIHYLTEDERKRASDGLTWTNPHFRHAATPGSRYDMADEVNWPPLNGSRGGGWSELKLLRDGANKTRVETKYCAIPVFSTPAWRTHLRSGMEAALAGG